MMFHVLERLTFFQAILLLLRSPISFSFSFTDLQDQNLPHPYVYFSKVNNSVIGYTCVEQENHRFQQGIHYTCLV